MKLIIISNRLPVTLTIHEDRITANHSVGGVTSALTSLLSAYKKPYIWVGWPGDVVTQKKEPEVTSLLQKNAHSTPVFLSKQEIKNYYEGFCNRTIWPLFHYAPTVAVYKDEYWQAYVKVNQLFANKVKEIYVPGDSIFIQDYHLMLVPELLRQTLPMARIGFFLHIPFPTFELFRILPTLWQKKLVGGIGSADVVGFHTSEYARYYNETVKKITSVAPRPGSHTGVFPYSIDAKAFENHEAKDTVAQQHPHKLILSIDRLDYTKGIPERLLGYRQFLSDYPEYVGKVTLLVIVVPSRTKIEEYQQLKQKIDTLVGEINGQFSTLDWQPIRYQYTSYSEKKLKKVYKRADIALVTPLRDGMNLIAKEYIASRDNGSGVLILSKFAGAAEELQEAIQVNPVSSGEMSRALYKAVCMPPKEQQARNRIMQRRIRKKDITWWFSSIMKTIETPKKRSIFEAVNSIRRAQTRMIFLDYDGTLVPFAPTPQEAIPSSVVLQTISRLAKDKNNHVVLSSGRVQKNLEDWFGFLPITIIAEHGAFMKYKGHWQAAPGLETGWRSTMKHLFLRYVQKVPRSFIEEKEASLAWHYRQSDFQVAQSVLQEIRKISPELQKAHHLRIIMGNKVVECKSVAITKGSAVKLMMYKEKPDCVIAIGDDVTDEDMFAALPKNAYTIKVGASHTLANWRLRNPQEVLQFLQKITHPPLVSHRAFLVES